MFSRRKKRKTRVEPRFEDRGGRKSAADFSVTAADRAAPPPARKRKPSSKKPGAKAASGARRKPAARGSSGGRRRTSGRGRGFVRGFVYWSFIACIWGGVALAGIIAWYGAQLPSASAWAVPDRPPNVKIVAVDGTLVTNRGATGGAAVGLHEMSPYIPKAVIAIEDRRYFSHFGVDPIGLARAMARNVMAGGLVQGGSTLTQQLAKNLFLTPERTVGRKVQEVLLALWLEHEYSKEQILELYLNRVYFGSGSYGVEAAARRYFGKSARDVFPARSGAPRRAFESAVAPVAEPQSRTGRKPRAGGSFGDARTGACVRHGNDRGLGQPGRPRQPLLVPARTIMSPTPSWRNCRN